MIIKMLVMFLIRIKLGLKKYEKFQFTNQKSDYDKYYFNEICLMKIEYDKHANSTVREASVSLNWLLNDECKIKKVD